MALYPATYIVYLTGPADSPLDRGANGNPLLRVWAYSYTEARDKARKACPTGHKIDRIDRND